MLAVKVAITRYISDDPQPGIVECELLDVHGRCWRFIEKTAIVSANTLDARTLYPQPGLSQGRSSGAAEMPKGVRSSESTPSALGEWNQPTG
jgi:hypothetical protein